MPSSSSPSISAVHPPRLPRALTWSIVFLAYTAIAVLLTGYRYLDDLSRHRTGTFAIRTLEEVTGVYSFLLLLPLMLRVANAYLFPCKSWPRMILWHLSAAVAFSAAHTLLMSLSRQLIAPLIGLGPYDYGIMLYRYPMEFSNDLVGCTSDHRPLFFLPALSSRPGTATRRRGVTDQARPGPTRKSPPATPASFPVQHPEHHLVSDVRRRARCGCHARAIERSSPPHPACLANSRNRLAEELEITGVYLQLMQKRYENKLRVSYAIDPVLNDSLVPQLILQPLLEIPSVTACSPAASAWTSPLPPIARTAAWSSKSPTLALVSARRIPPPFSAGAWASPTSAIASPSFMAPGQEFHIRNCSAGGAEVTVRVPFRVAASSASAFPSGAAPLGA